MTVPKASTHDLIMFFGQRNELQPEIADYIAAQLEIEGSEICKWYNNLERKLAATPDEIDWSRLLLGAATLSDPAESEPVALIERSAKKNVGSPNPHAMALNVNEKVETFRRSVLIRAHSCVWTPQLPEELSDAEAGVSLNWRKETGILQITVTGFLDVSALQSLEVSWLNSDGKTKCKTSNDNPLVPAVRLLSPNQLPPEIGDKFVIVNVFQPPTSPGWSCEASVVLE